MMSHTLEDVVARQKSRCTCDLLAIIALVIGLAFAIIAVVPRIPDIPATGRQATETILEEGQSAATLAARHIDDTPVYQ